MLKLGNTSLCFSAFRELLGIPDRTLRYWSSNVRHGVVEDNSSPRRAVKASIAADWITKYAKRTGDAQPDKPVIHLPATLWKRDVYNDFVASHSSIASIIPSQVYLISQYVM